MEQESDGLRQRAGRQEDKEVESHLRDTQGLQDQEKDLGDVSESWSSVLVQVTPPYLCAGLGMVGAGLVLDSVQYWSVFKTLPELFIMVPALIGLKGNLEMTLASRLSTHANLGDLDTMEQTVVMGSANLALIQVQGVVVGALASVIAMLMAWLGDWEKVDMAKALLMCASSVVTASLASFILGIVMVIVIAMSRRFSVNPDNVATPIAAALGDLVTLSLLAFVANFFNNSGALMAVIILLGYVVVTPFCFKRAKNNVDTCDILYNGWTPVLSAMVISSMGGKILNNVISKFPDIAVFQPVINGVAGNLVGIQASRISTELHRTSKLGKLPKDITTCNLINPFFTFSISCCSFSPMMSNNAVAAGVLLLLVVPGHLVFNLAIGISQGFHILSPVFLIMYLLAALLQVGSLLHIANMMVHRMWSHGINPDNSAIPYLTALGDLMGGAFLAAVFQIVHWVD